MKTKANILMISSSSSLGGGTKHMFMLGKNLKFFKIYYAIPKNKNFRKFLNDQNHLAISERRISLLDIIRLSKFVRSKSIDIIHAHGKGAGAIARILVILNKKKLVYTFHGIHLTCHSFIQRIIYIVYEFFWGRIDSIKILVSESEKEYARKSKIFLGKNNIVINNGVKNMPNKYSRIIKNENETNSGSSKIKVISVCRFVHQKNIVDILRIASKIPSVNFSIVGDGPLMSEIKNFIVKNKLKNVDLIGKRKKVFDYLYNSDIYLSTSLYEGLPLSILEAMSIGLPIVASNVTGNCDTIVNGKSGYLYDSNDIKYAIACIKKLSRNKKLRINMGNSAYERQRALFSKKLMIYNYSDLYIRQKL